MVQRILDASVLLTDAEKRAVLHDTGKRVFVKGGMQAAASSGNSSLIAG